MELIAYIYEHEMDMGRLCCIPILAPPPSTKAIICILGTYTMNHVNVKLRWCFEEV